MKSKVIALSIFAVMLFAGGASAQTDACPTINIYGPVDDITPGKPITFSVNVSGGASTVVPTYNWVVSTGTIASGQGTPTISMESANIAGQFLTATVMIGGYPPTCDQARSASVAIKPAPTGPPPIRFDEYGAIRETDENVRLDHFAIELERKPSHTGFIIVYGGRSSDPAESRAAVKRIFTYLVTTRGINVSRLQTLDGGYREEPTRELFLVAAGATPPEATPTVSASEVVTPLQRGMTAFQAGNYGEAITILTRAISADPKNADAYYFRGNAKFQTQDWRGAIADYDKMIELNPVFANTYHLRGVAKSNLKDHKGAIADMTKAIELDPKFVNAYQSRGTSKYESNDLAGAAADFGRMIELAPGNAAGYYGRGATRDDLKDHEGAIKDFTQAISLSPATALYYRGRAIAYRKIGKTALAEADEKKAATMK